MRATIQERQDARKKLKELRRSARDFKPTVLGTVKERKSAALKGYRDWSDLREQADKLGTR